MLRSSVESIRPEWPVASSVVAASSTRSGGCSAAPFLGLNLGGHVGDDSRCVAENRRRFERSIEAPAPPVWLDQVHGADVVDAASGAARADAAYTSEPGTVCAVLTADCLPVLFCDRRGTEVAAAHAGWRGLAAGVLERTVERFAAAREDIVAWIGPGIGSSAYEVSSDVRDAFIP